MPQVTPTSNKLYAYFNSAWTELNDVAPWRGSWGISGNGPLDRVAETGEMTFTLDNSAGYYTPGGPSMLTGWQRGIPFRWVVTFDGESYIRFRGYIADIDIRPTIQKLAYVTALDWMDYAARFPLINPGIQSNQTGDEVITWMLSQMAIVPQVRELAEGTEVFPTAFDTVNSKTTFMAEATKVALSELSYVYLKKDQFNGETLVFENANSRPATREADPVPLVSSSTGFLLLETGDKLLLETGDKLILNDTEAVTFDNSIIVEFDAPYGEQVINHMTARAFPRRLDTSPQILFQLDAPIQIGIGVTKTIKGTYADPSGGDMVHAQDMIDPVITTDYLMNTRRNGTGTDISANLTIVTNYGADGFEHTVTNSGSSVGYITQFNCRGTGIYVYNPIEYAASNSSSIAEFGYEKATFDQKYKDNLETTEAFVDSAVDEENQPRISLNKITMFANRSNREMMAFLYADVGNLYYISLSELGLAGNYYIQGVEFEVNGGIIKYSWHVRLGLSLLAGLTPLAVQYNTTLADAIVFGASEPIDNLTQKTYSTWIHYSAIGVSSVIVSKATYNASGGGDLLWFGRVAYGAGKPVFTYEFDVTNGTWRTTNDVLTAGTNSWVHVAVTYDSSNVSNDPVIYINGSAVAVTEVTAPVGSRVDDSSSVLVAGNVYEATVGYSYAFPGKIFDPRVYNRILTAAEVSTLYNSGTPSASVGSTDGLVFQAFFVQDGVAADYIDTTLTSDMKLRDNVYGVLGTPNGSPVGRAAP